MYADAKRLDGIRYDKELFLGIKELALQANPVPKRHENAHKIIDLFEELSLHAIETCCESEIEKQLAYGMLTVGKMEGEFIQFITPHVFSRIIAQDDLEEVDADMQKYLRSAEMLIVPNMPVNHEGKSYRIDFLVSVRPKGKKKKKVMLIECDSFQYHSTAEALEKDKKRERALTSLGEQIIRFSGREIHRNPTQCGMEALERCLGKTYGEK